VIKTIPQVRPNDAYGSGHYGASRGTRKHLGIDFACMQGTIILSPVNGFITKLGYTYKDDLSFRYVQVTTADHYNYRFFYVKPSVKMGDAVNVDSPLGVVQDLTKRYPANERHESAITNHCHFEITNEAGQHINPEKLC